MNRLYVLVPLLLLSANLAGQPLTFQKVSADSALNLDVVGTQVLRTSKGQYLISGWVDTLDGKVTDHCFSLLMDTTGQIQWQRRYYAGEFSFFTEAVEAPDGGFVFLGTVAKNGSEFEPLLLKTDSAGNMLWNRRWNLVALFSGAAEVEWKLLPVPDGYIVTGTRNGAGQGFMWYLDLDGNTIWHKSYDFIPVVGYVEGDTIFTSGASGKDYCLSKISRTTGLVYSAARLKFPVSGGGYVQDCHLIVAPDGDFIVSAYAGVYDRIWCMKISRAGVVKWSKLYGQNLDGNGICVTHDNGVVLACQTFIPPAEAVSVRIDSSGAVDWAYGFGTTEAHTLEDVLEDPDGQLVFTGEIRVSGVLRLLLLRTDAYGLVEGCCFRQYSVSVADLSVTSVPFVPVVGDLPAPGPQVLTPEPLLLSLQDYCAPAHQPQYTTQEVLLCPGQSTQINGIAYTAPATALDTFSTFNGCDSIVTYTLQLRPYNARTETILFCPGDSVHLLGQVFTQPGFAAKDTLLSANACDTIVTYVLQYANAGQASAVTITCPKNISVDAGPGATSAAVVFDLPVAYSNCVCPGIALAQTQGAASGSNFPVGTTTLCFTMADSCHSTASCCFQVAVKAAPLAACDVKQAGCLTYELLRITRDAQQRKSYTVRVTNHCASELLYVAIQLPDGVTADAPADGSTFTAASGRAYAVRNPNYSPFYSIRFKAQGAGLGSGQSEVFRYTLPPQADPTFIHVTARLALQTFVEAHLNTFGCVVENDPTVSRPLADRGAEPAESLGLQPNPSTGMLWLDLRAWPDAPVRVAVFDVQGRLAGEWRLSGGLERQALELPAALSNGMYLLKVMPAAQAPVLRRFLLQR